LVFTKQTYKVKLHGMEKCAINPFMIRDNPTVNEVASVHMVISMWRCFSLFKGI